MIARPAQEWTVVAAEPTSVQAILRGYVVPLAIIQPVCTLAGALIFQHPPIVFACASAVLLFALEIVSVFVVAFVAENLASTFGGVNDKVAAFKWVAYAFTARWLGGVFTFFPWFGWLILLVATLYSFYLLLLGAPPVMRVAPERAAGFTVLVVVASIVVGLVVQLAVKFALGILFVGAMSSVGAM